MGNSQQIMPGIFMVAGQAGDAFAPYFEYTVANTRAEGSARVEVTIDFARSVNVAVNGRGGLVAVCVVGPGEETPAAVVRAAHADQVGC
jgi:hypothetical protein